MVVRTDVERVPTPIALGPEMETLARFYRDSTWDGRIHEGGRAPEPPP